MKETGLMFKAPLVCAILSGQKTQTRRIVNWRDLQPGLNLGFSDLKVFSNTPNTFTLESQSRNGWESRSGPTRCPMGQLGDRIYVRETHSHRPYFPQIAFRADGEEFEDADGFLWEPKWTPAIHMKKKEARIWLEVTGVRVERLQDINEGDADREGVELKDGSDEPYSDTNLDGFRYRNYQSKEGAFDCGSARESFRTLWESTGGDWAENPWVWVIDFKRIETPR